MKNLNSFRYLQRALEHEIERQSALLDAARTCAHETRLFDVGAARTVVMRSKEEAHDYRYFPEPDLPPLRVDAARVERLRALLPELPEARAAPSHRRPTALRVRRRRRSPPRAPRPPTSRRRLQPGAAPKAVGELADGRGGAAAQGAGAAIERAPRAARTPWRNCCGSWRTASISVSVAKDVFATMWASSRRGGGHRARRRASRRSATQGRSRRSSGTSSPANTKAVAQYRAGKTLTLGFLVGQVMKATGGKANPGLVNDLMLRELERA